MLKKTLLLFLAVVGFHTAHAQANLIRLGVNSFILAKRLHNKNTSNAEPVAKSQEAAAAAKPVALASGTYEGKEFPMMRTPTDQLPKKGAEQIVAMETELDRCHAALLASPTSLICTPAQRTALQAAMSNLARTNAAQNLVAYQQEATFYLAEDARRQQAPTPPAPAN